LKKFRFADASRIPAELVDLLGYVYMNY